MAEIESTQYYYELFATMIKEDEDNMADNAWYDNAYHFNWQLPPGFEQFEWISKYVSPVAHDTVNVTVKTLGTNEPHIHYFPLDTSEATRQWANNIEEVLKWNLYLAGKRKRGRLIPDIVRHSCMYDKICTQVIDIDHQIASIKAAGGSSDRFEAMRRYSRFMVNTYHPNLVHFRQSNVMLEAVLLAQVKSAYEIYKEFGEAAAKVKEYAESQDKQPLFNLYDFMDDTVRVVIATPEEVGTGGKVEDIIKIIEPQEHKLKFIPWAINCGGSESELNARDRYHGILFPLLRGNLWEFLNRAESLIQSRAMALAGEPGYYEEGGIPISARSTIIDRDNPEGIIQVTPGDTLKQTQKDASSPAMLEAEQRLKTDVATTTGTQTLQLLGVAPGTAYATLSLLMQNAAGNIDPYRQTAEDHLEDINRLMLLWSCYRDVPLEGLGKNWKSEDYGMFYSIDPKEIDPFRIHMKVELRQNLPTDMMQRVNTVTMGIQTMGLSKETGMEMCGIDDPLREMNLSVIEKMKDHKLQMYFAEEEAALQAKIQEAQAVTQMQMQALKGQQNPPGEPNPMVSGQQFNPAEGGTPPAMANPNATMEMQTGMTRGGTEGV